MRPYERTIMNEDPSVQVQEVAAQVIVDYKKRMRREKIKMILPAAALFVATTAAAVYALKQYNEVEENEVK